MLVREGFKVRISGKNDKNFHEVNDEILSIHIVIRETPPKII